MVSRDVGEGVGESGGVREWGSEGFLSTRVLVTRSLSMS